MTNTFEKDNLISAAVVVHSRKQVENLRKILNKKGESISVTSLIVGKKGRVDIGVLRAPCNLETTYLSIRSQLVKTSKTTARVVNRFTKDLINLEIRDTKYLKLVSTEIYRVGEGMNERFFVESDKAGMVFDLLNRSLVADGVIRDEAGNLVDGVFVYNGVKGGQNASASQVRKLNITLACNNDVERMLNRFDIVTYGAFDLLKGEVTDASGLVKYSARFGQYKAPSCLQNFSVNTFAVFMAKWKDAECNEYRDGSAIASSRFVAEAFTSVSPDRYKFLPRAVVGIPIQCRPWTTKVQAQTKEQAYIDEFIRHNGEVIRILRSEVDHNVQKNFNLAFKKNEGPYAGKLVVICDDLTSPIDFMTDTNGLKAVFKLERKSGFNVLDIGNTRGDLNTGADTSMQQLQTLLYANPEKARAYIEKMGMLHMESAKAMLLTDEATVPSIAEFDHLYAATTVPKFARSFVKNNCAKLFRTAVNNFVKGCSSAIEGLKFNIPGANNKIVPDFAADFGARIMGVLENGAVEMYSAAAERYFTEQGIPEGQWFSIGVKYPKMHVLEYADITFLSVKEVERRIKANETLTVAQKNLLVRDYKALSESVVVVPAIELLKNMLAGMDFDADAMVITFDQEFVSIIHEAGLKPMAVVIEKEDDDEGNTKDETKHIVGADAGWIVYDRFANNKNKTIGEITLMVDMFISLLIKVRRGDLNDAKKVLELAFKGEHAVAYETPLKIEVDKATNIPFQVISTRKMIDITGRVCDMELNQDNMLAALFDLITVGRMLQERTIDSAKTNDKVIVPFDINAVAELKSRTDIELAINWNEPNVTKPAESESDDVNIDEEDEVRVKTKEYKGVFFKLDSSNSGFVGKKNDMYSVMNDFQETRLNLTRKLWTISMELKAMKQALSDTQIAMQQQVVIREDVEPLMKAVLDAKMIYDDATGIMRKETKGKEGECRAAITNEYNKIIDALSNYVRRLTINMDAVDRAMMLMNIGGKSNFAFTVCQEEFVRLVATKYAEIDFAGEKLGKCDFEVGEVISFAGGIANSVGKMAVSKSAISGEFEIREYNGKKYATKKIVDLVKVPEVNMDQIIFRTASNKNISVTDVANLSKILVAGKNVELRAFDGDSIIVDGEKVGKFNCLPGGVMSKAFRRVSGTIERASVGNSVGNDGKLYNVMIAVINKAEEMEVTKAEIAAAAKAEAKARIVARENADKEIRAYGTGVNFGKNADTSF